MKQRALYEFTAPVAVGLMLLSACSTQAAPTEEPIRVGVLVTLTGAFAQLGQDGADGVKIAFDEVGNMINRPPGTAVHRRHRCQRINGSRQSPGPGESR